MVQHYVSKYKTWQFLEHKIEISKYWAELLLQNFYTRYMLIKADHHVVLTDWCQQVTLYLHWVLVSLWAPEAGLGRGHEGEAPHLGLPPVQFPVILGLVTVHEADLPPGGQPSSEAGLGARARPQPASLTVLGSHPLILWSSSNVQSSQSQSSSLLLLFTIVLGCSFIFSSFHILLPFKIYWGSVGGLWTNKNAVWLPVTNKDWESNQRSEFLANAWRMFSLTPFHQYNLVSNCSKANL